MDIITKRSLRLTWFGGSAAVGVPATTGTERFLKHGCIQCLLVLVQLTSNWECGGGGRQPQQQTTYCSSSVSEVTCFTLSTAWHKSLFENCSSNISQDATWHKHTTRSGVECFCMKLWFTSFTFCSVYDWEFLLFDGDVTSVVYEQPGPCCGLYSPQGSKLLIGSGPQSTRPQGLCTPFTEYMIFVILQFELTLPGRKPIHVLSCKVFKVSSLFTVGIQTCVRLMPVCGLRWKLAFFSLPVDICAFVQVSWVRSGVRYFPVEGLLKDSDDLQITYSLSPSGFFSTSDWSVLFTMLQDICFSSTMSVSAPQTSEREYLSFHSSSLLWTSLFL